MAIKDPVIFITVDDFKNWKGFDKLLFDETTNSNENIWFAINIASSNIDYLSGFAISSKWPEQTPTAFTDNVQLATAHYVRFLCTKGVDYTRGQASMAQGGIVYSENNPNDPYYVPPEVFNYLRKIKEYTAFQGFNIDVKPKTSFFSNFLSDKGEINPLELYVQATNIRSDDPRTKITLSGEPINIQGVKVVIDTTGIKDGSTINVDDKSFELVNDKLTLKDAEVGERLNTLIDYLTLNTISKKIIGAINELLTNISNKQNTLNDSNDTYMFHNEVLIKDEVFKTRLFKDLQTNSKEIINAINEIKNSSGSSLSFDPESFNVTNDLVTLLDDKISIRFNNVIEYRMLLKTGNATIIGAINELYSGKQKTLIDNDDTSIDHRYSQVLINKEVFTKREFERDLQTTDKTIIGAINEIKNSGGGGGALLSFDTESFSVVNNFVKLLDDKISIRFNNVIEYPTLLQTLSKTIIGAINEVSAKISNLILSKQDALVDSTDTTIVGNKIFLVKPNNIPTVNWNLNIIEISQAGSDNLVHWKLTLNVIGWDGKSRYIFTLYSDVVDSPIGTQKMHNLKLSNVSGITDYGAYFKIDMNDGAFGIVKIANPIDVSWDDKAENFKIIDLAYVTLEKLTALTRIDFIFYSYDFRQTATLTIDGSIIT